MFNIVARLAVISAVTISSLSGVASAAPVIDTNKNPVFVRTVIEKQKKKEFKCKNKAAQILHEAGFRGWSHKMAWAITYRESKHTNLDEGSPWYTGALGFWQVQTSAHSGKSWWSRSAMLDPLRQSKIVYKHMTNKGKYWVPWGLNSDGTLNTSHYGGWSSWHHENWIMAPFRKGLSLYPC